MFLALRNFLFFARKKSGACLVESVDTADLKSAAHKTGMPVRFRPRAPEIDSKPSILLVYQALMGIRSSSLDYGPQLPLPF